MARIRGIADGLDRQGAGLKPRIRFGTVVACVAVPVAVAVGLVGIGHVRAVVGAVGNAVAIDVVRLEHRARVGGIERARIAHVAFAIAVGVLVGLRGVHRAHRIEYGRAVVLGVGHAVAVLVAGSDAVRVGVAPGDAARLAAKGSAQLEVSGKMASPAVRTAANVNAPPVSCDTHAFLPTLHTSRASHAAPPITGSSSSVASP